MSLWKMLPGTIHRSRPPGYRPRVEVLETRALPSFIAAPAFTAGLRPNCVAVGDLNGDGQTDLVTTNFYQRDFGDFRIIESDVRVFLNKGDGTFQDAQVFQAGRGPLSVAIADFNGDGIPDLAVSNGGAVFLPDHTVSILMGNGDGTFQAPQNYDAGAHPYFVVVGDFNGDNIPDLAAVGSGVNCLLGNGDGTFQPPQNYAVDSSSFMATGDFNRDGKLDIVTDAGTLLLGNGDGTFQAVQSFSGFAYAVAVGDFNGDGIPDLATVQDSGLNILLGNGDGTFQTAQNYASRPGRSTLVAADFNGDGILDLAVTNEFSQTLSVLLGNGDGSFQAAQEYVPGPYPRAVAVTDFNGDGFPDLAVANEAGADGLGPGSITILINAADWGGGGHAALPPGGAPVPLNAHHPLHSYAVPALVEGSPLQAVGTLDVASTTLPPNPAWQWHVPSAPLQTNHAVVSAVPRLLTTTRHAQDAAFERWDNEVREVLAWTC